MEPDLLLLDEPTNHLDLVSLLWFQEYLENYPGAMLLISHDREFLDELVEASCEIATGSCSVTGQLQLPRQKAAREEQQRSAYKNQQKEIATLQQFADRFRAKASKASQAQSKLKQIERMEKIEAPTAQAKTIKFRFPQPPRSGQRAISLKESATHMANGVYDVLNLSAERGQRTVLVGPNGAGKSTLLKLLAGVLPLQRRRTRTRPQRPGRLLFPASRRDAQRPAHRPRERARCSRAGLGTNCTRPCSARFLFRGDDVFKTVGVLSGGEKSRLALVKLLLDPPNLLLMDEPTTHLDVGSIDALIGALKQYRRHAHFHQSRRAFHPRDRDQRAAHQRRPAHALRRRLSVLSR